jgi:hypothetical protein
MTNPAVLEPEEYQVIRAELEDLVKTIEEIDDIILPTSVPELQLSLLDGLIIRLREAAEKMMSIINVIDPADDL